MQVECKLISTTCSNSAHLKLRQLVIFADFMQLGKTIGLKIDNLDRVTIPTKIVATFDVEHAIHGTTYGV